jgi:hypothetical protein
MLLNMRATFTFSGLGLSSLLYSRMQSQWMIQTTLTFTLSLLSMSAV